MSNEICWDESAPGRQFQYNSEAYQYKKSLCGLNSVIFTMGFPILGWWHLDTEMNPGSAPWFCLLSCYGHQGDEFGRSLWALLPDNTIITAPRGRIILGNQAALNYDLIPSKVWDSVCYFHSQHSQLLIWPRNLSNISHPTKIAMCHVIMRYHYPIYWKVGNE